MQSGWKLARALGIANLAIIHRFSDLGAVGDAGSESRNVDERLRDLIEVVPHPLAPGGYVIWTRGASDSADDERSGV